VTSAAPIARPNEASRGLVPGTCGHGDHAPGIGSHRAADSRAAPALLPIYQPPRWYVRNRAHVRLVRRSWRWTNAQRDGPGVGNDAESAPLLAYHRGSRYSATSGPGGRRSWTESVSAGRTAVPRPAGRRGRARWRLNPGGDSTLVAGVDLAAVGADHLLGQVPRHLLVVIDLGAERTPTVGQ
jgi:hypothetical protein